MSEDLAKQVEEMLLEDARKRESQTMMDDAKSKAAQIIKAAEDEARAIYGASLEYVDDMLSEVNLAVLKAKEEIRLYCEEVIKEFEIKADMINSHKNEIMEQLRDASENGNRPIKKAKYDIKVDEAFFPKKEYAVKANDGTGEKVEVHKPPKQAYEIKIADEWKEQIEEMLEIPEIPEEIPIAEEPEEEENGFQASDFDLDAEYFSWLDENKK